MASDFLKNKVKAAETAKADSAVGASASSGASNFLKQKAEQSGVPKSSEFVTVTYSDGSKMEMTYGAYQAEVAAAEQAKKEFEAQRNQWIKDSVAAFRAGQTLLPQTTEEILDSTTPVHYDLTSPRNPTAQKVYTKQMEDKIEAVQAEAEAEANKSWEERASEPTDPAETDKNIAITAGYDYAKGNFDRAFDLVDKHIAASGGDADGSRRAAILADMEKYANEDVNSEDHRARVAEGVQAYGAAKAILDNANAYRANPQMLTDAARVMGENQKYVDEQKQLYLWDSKKKSYDMRARFSSLSAPDAEALDRTIEEANKAIAPLKENLKGMHRTEDYLWENEPNDIFLYPNGKDYEAARADFVKGVANAETEASHTEEKIRSYEAQIYYAEGTKVLATLTEAERATVLDGMTGSREQKAKYNALRKELLAAGYSEEDLSKMEETVDAYHNAVTMADKETGAAKFSLEAPIAANLLSVVQNLVGGVAATADVLAQSIAKPDVPMDFNAPWQTPAHEAKAVRDTTAKAIMENADSQAAGDVAVFFYNTAMSCLDSLAVGYVTGGVSKVAEAAGGGEKLIRALQYTGDIILGSSAGYESMLSVKENGGTDAQALGAGLAAGFFEGFFEHFSLGELRALQAKPIGSIKRLFLELLKASGVNASEEMATEFADMVSEYMIAGGASDIGMQVTAMQNEGLSEAQIKQKLAGYMLGRIGLAGVGGALQGGMMTGTVGVANYAKSSQLTAEMFTSDGKLDTESVNALIGEGIASADKHTRALAERMQGKEIKLSDLSQLYAQLREEHPDSGMVSDLEREETSPSATGTGIDQNEMVTVRNDDGTFSRMTYGEWQEEKSNGVFEGKSTPVNSEAALDLEREETSPSDAVETSQSASLTAPLTGEAVGETVRAELAQAGEPVGETVRTNLAQTGEAVGETVRAELAQTGEAVGDRADRKAESTTEQVKRMLAGDVNEKVARSIVASAELSAAYETVTGKKLSGSKNKKAETIVRRAAAAAEKIRLQTIRRMTERVKDAGYLNTPESMRSAVGNAGLALYNAEAGKLLVPFRMFGKDAVSRFHAEFGAYYNQGLNGQTFTSLNGRIYDREARSIYEAGANDAASLAKTGKSVYTENKTEENGNERRNESSSRDGRRTDVVDAGKSGQGIQRGTGSTKARGTSQQVRATQIRTAVDAVRKERVSTSSLGIKRGTGNQTLRVVDQSLWTPQMRKIAEQQRKNGREVVYFTGQLEMRDGKGIFHARGAISEDRKTIWVKADHDTLTIEQIIRHEEYHAMVSQDSSLLKKTREKIIADHSREELDSMIAWYADQYGSTEMDASEIFEEICADAYAGIDIFEDVASHAEGATRFADSVNGTAEKANASAKSATDAKFSRDEDERRRALRKGEMVNKFRGNVNWLEYYKKIQQDKYNPDYFEDGETATITVGGKKLALEMRSNGEWSVVGIIGGKNDKSGIRCKDHERTGLSAINNHDASRYDSSFGRSKGNRDENNRGSGKRNESASSEQATATADSKSNKKSTGKVKEKFSRETDADYMDAVERGDTEAAQAMVDEAAKAAGYETKIYHGTSAEFTVFDISKADDAKGGHSHAEGIGFYLTDSKQIAESYGSRIIDGYTNIHNPFFSDKLTLKRGEVLKIVKAVEALSVEEYDEYDIVRGNYDVDSMGEAAARNQLVSDLMQNDNDSDLLYDILSFSGARYNAEDAQKVYKAIYDATGRDGIKSQWDSGNVYVAFFSEQIKSADPVTYDDAGNVIPLSERFDRKKSDIRFSREIEYTYDGLTSKPDMQITEIDDTVQYTPNSGTRKQIVNDAMKNAASVGTVRSDGGVEIYVGDIGRNVTLYKTGLVHGLDRRLQKNAAVTLHAGEILQNSIRINELRLEKRGATESYVLLGAATNDVGDPYLVEFVVNHSDIIESIDVLYSINTKKESAAHEAPGSSAEKRFPITDSTISIAQLLDFATKTFPDVLPESVLRHYGYTERPDGTIGKSALFSRETNAAEHDKMPNGEDMPDSITIRTQPITSTITMLRGGMDFFEVSKKTGVGLREIALQMDSLGEKVKEIRALTGMYKDDAGVWRIDDAWIDSHVPDLGERRNAAYEEAKSAFSLRNAQITPEELEAARRRINAAESNVNRILRPTAEQYANDRVHDAVGRAIEAITEGELPTVDAVLRDGVTLLQIAERISKTKDKKTVARSTGYFKNDAGEWEIDQKAMIDLINAGSKDLSVNDYLEFEKQNAKELSDEEYNVLYGMPEPHALRNLGVKITSPMVDIAAAGNKPKVLRNNERDRYRVAQSLEKLMREHGSPTSAERADAEAIVLGRKTLADLTETERRNVVLDLVYLLQAKRALRDGSPAVQFSLVRDRFAEKIGEVLNSKSEDGEKIREKPLQQLILTVNTSIRNSYLMFGRTIGQKVNEMFFEPIAENEAERMRFLYEQEKRIIRLKLNGFESAAVQMLAENTTQSLEAYEALLAENGKHINVKKVKNAVNVFQSLYNEYYDAVNDFLVMHGYDPIGHQKNYMPHTQSSEEATKMRETLKRLGFETENVTELPTEIAGRTEDYKPGHKWNPFFLLRAGGGGNVVYDAVANFDAYVTYLSEVLYHTDDIQKLRVFGNYLRAQNSNAEIKKNIAAIKEELYGNDPDKDAADLNLQLSEAYGKLEAGKLYGTYCVWLDDYIDRLAGKQGKTSDRAAERTSGRTGLNLGKKLTNASSRSSIVGNVSSAITQLVQIPIAAAEAGGFLNWHMHQAFIDIAFTHRLNRTMDFDARSDFYIGKQGVRYASDAKAKNFADFAHRLEDFASIPFNAFDNFATRLIIRTKYYQLLSKGNISSEEAIKQANRYIRDLIGSRMKGAKPLLFEEKNIMKKVFTMYQLEVANAWGHIIMDLPLEYKTYAKAHGVGRAVLKLLANMVSALFNTFLFNRLAQAFYGQTPAQGDLIGVFLDSMGEGYGITGNMYLGRIADNLWESVFGTRPFVGEKKDLGEFDGVKAVKKAGTEVVDDIPFLSNIAVFAGLSDGRFPLPVLYDKKLGKGIWELIEGDDGKEALDLILQGGGRMLASWLPMGSQIRKTNRGLRIIKEKGQRTTSGNVMYAAEGSLWNNIRLLAFGPTALEAYNTYWASGGTPLSDTQTKVYDNLLAAGVHPNEAYDIIKDINSEKEEAREADEKQKQAAFAVIKKNPISDAQKNLLYYAYVATDTEKEVMNTLQSKYGVSPENVWKIMRDNYEIDIKDFPDLNKQYKEKLQSAESMKEEESIYRKYIGLAKIQNWEDFGEISSEAKCYAFIKLYGNNSDTEKEIYDELVNGEALSVEEKLEMLFDGEKKESTFNDYEGLWNVLTAETTRDRVYAIAASSMTEHQKEVAFLDSVDVNYDKIDAFKNAGGNINGYLLWYVANRNAVSEKDGKNLSQEEAKKAIDSIPGLTKTERAALWQITNKSWSPKNNPYDIEISKTVKDALNK